ncbi:hypothetical protein CBR_g2932 [Chara braunii]|uniref:Uncharacterized protein n=1 Tax=Chara braunii TaxID=69332 RepID=A0A388KEB2_CHABU|nr:hypothetical protein CBR_g2932 [Chara braunii]|eukprot:GBG68389.1 hypothetical protein CBR_g2932 [Chara braunii]
MTSPQTIHRQSILLRQKKPASKTNICNLDSEYARELSLWKAKAERWKKHEEETRISLCPEKEEKLRRQEEVRLAMEEHLRLREEDLRRKLEQQVVATQCRPGSSFSHAYWEDLEERRQREKREYLQSILEENKKLVAYRNALHAWEKERDIEEERNRPRTSTWDRRHFR